MCIIMPYNVIMLMCAVKCRDSDEHHIKTKCMTKLYTYMQVREKKSNVRIYTGQLDSLLR